MHVFIGLQLNVNYHLVTTQCLLQTSYDPYIQSANFIVGVTIS